MTETVPAGYETVDECLYCGSSSSEPLFSLGWSETCRQRFSSMAAYRDKTGFLFVRRCRDCGLEYQSPRPTEALLLPIVDDCYEVRPLNPIRQSLFKRDLRLIKRFLAPGASLLDVGCNTGAFLDLAKDVYDVRGCDPIVRALEYGRKTFGLTKLCQGTLAEAPLEKVDAIVSLDVFEHLHDPKAFLREACRRLKRGGILYIRTIRRDGFNARLCGKSWYGYCIWHLLYPTVSHTVDLCRSVGLNLLTVEIARKDWFHLKGSLKYHTKRALGAALPFVPRFHRFNRDIERGKPYLAFYRDAFAAVFAYPGADEPGAGPESTA